VSWRPAVSTTDQWVVTKTWRRDVLLSGVAAPVSVAGEDVLTSAD